MCGEIIVVDIFKQIREKKFHWARIRNKSHRGATTDMGKFSKSSGRLKKVRIM